ncbi:hypothetical protein DICPUDRAFT_29490 [Dictyostelium purpureum]|uniref:Poly [ADP-ribose] polymerase n=1 Tax=Dictyostelium purpureum TaxID=5786 RepID=F0ZDM9_DICPU|nr:uncharacterized protein DICPUDRAFT_29490 [Dictyostelium purpureum]EGC37965.1 hypothetical protein DICPUDRAFT_29490 [Dictyostelium purpureum]|eukprot:XP_003285536.1 hypothetical protein DICPUDRAFT_29490 [Dictyostelium purpureum]
MYGENNFYKLQIIYNPNLDRYFIFNRWGRIGDSGQYQKTPYSKEEAINEFCKLFKQKTGNIFSQATMTNFQRVDGKYHLLNIDRTDRSKKEVLHPFDLSKYPPSKLPKEIFDVMSQFCNVEAISNQLKSLKIDTDIMPLGRLSKDAINNAVAILGKNDDTLPPINEVLESQLELSNKFFELIPHSDFRTEKMQVLRHQHEIATKIKLLQNLDEMETVSKILIAAHQNSSMHPYDYCFKAVNVCMEKLNENTPEFEIIKKYTLNTGCHQKIHNVYKIQRKGEPEKFQQHKSLKNHYLLWHGSLTTNYLSILSQGLKIAPPEAPATGYMFGKGVYFADMFQKSINYCKSWQTPNTSNRNFLLLSEVALGTMAEFKSAHYMESPQTGTNSTKGVGKNGPNFDNSIILNNGVCIPLSKPEQVKDTTGYFLEMNEYIVYNTSQIRMRYLVEVSQ